MARNTCRKYEQLEPKGAKFGEQPQPQPQTRCALLIRQDRQSAHQKVHSIEGAPLDKVRSSLWPFVFFYKPSIDLRQVGGRFARREETRDLLLAYLWTFASSPQDTALYRKLSLSLSLSLFMQLLQARATRVCSAYFGSCSSHSSFFFSFTRQLSVYTLSLSLCRG